MKSTVVRVPASLLLDPELKSSAKLIWMVLRLHGCPVGPALVEARSGLSRPTVLKGLAQLAATGWCSAGSANHTAAVDRAPSDARAIVPGDLLADRRVGVRARILYGVLQLTPEFRNQTGRFTYACLGGLARASLNTVKQAVRELVHTGWLQVTQPHQLAPNRFSISNPVVARTEAEATRVRRRLEEAPFRGEALMREYLSLLVDSDDFEDNAAPGFLVNPWTGERMELDRFYPPSVAFEFNGPQHYGPTDRFSMEDAARQRGRDYMKLGICVTKGIRLLVIHPENLSLEAMKQKIGHLLPLRDLNGHEPLTTFLESVSRRYRLAARRGRASTPAAARPSFAADEHTS